MGRIRSFSVSASAFRTLVTTVSHRWLPLVGACIGFQSLFIVLFVSGNGCSQHNGIFISGLGGVDVSLEHNNCCVNVGCNLSAVLCELSRITLDGDFPIVYSYHFTCYDATLCARFYCASDGDTVTTVVSLKHFRSPSVRQNAVLSHLLR